MKKNNYLKFIPAFAILIAITIFVAIIAMPASVSYADEKNSINYNEKDYCYIDSVYTDADDNVKTYERSYNISENDLDAYVSSALHMPKGRYAQMSIKYDLVKLMLDNAMSLSAFNLDKYEIPDESNILIVQDSYSVKGYNFLSHSNGAYFKVATSNDVSGNYVVGDYYNNDNPSDVYLLKDYIENRISKFALDDLNSSYVVDSNLIFEKYYTLKDEYSGDATLDATIKIVLNINFSPITLSPVEDGDVFTATGEYVYENELTKGSSLAFSYVTFAVNQEAFDVENGGYNVDVDKITKLPSNATLKYVIDNNVVVDTTNNYILLSSLPDEAYTLQGLLTFTTKDSKEITLKSNVLTIQNHTFDIRTDNIYSTNVKLNEEYSYTLSVDRGKTLLSSLSNIQCIWSFNYDKNDSSKAVKISSTNPKYTYSEEGTKYTYVELEGDFNKYEHMSFIGMYEQEVSQNPVREMPVYDITFNITDGSTLVVGGEMIDVSAQINTIYGDENFTLSYFLSAGSNADNVSQDASKLTINPINSGNATIVCKATSEIVGSYEKSISINIVNPKSDTVELVSESSFNKTGNDLIVKVSIGGQTEFLNYKPTWTVKVESGQDKNAVDFVTNEKGDAVVLSADSGYYLFSISDDVLTVEETTFRVAKINMQQMAKKYLPFIALAMVLAIIIVTLLKKKVLVGKTVANQLKKINALINKRLNAPTYTKKQFVRDASSILFRLNSAVNIAEELDQKSLGQHQPLIAALTTSKKIIGAAVLKQDSMTIEKIKMLLENLKTKYIEPTIALSANINEVMEKFENERVKNIMVVDPEANEKDKNK